MESVGVVVARVQRRDLRRSMLEKACERPRAEDSANLEISAATRRGGTGQAKQRWEVMLVRWRSKASWRRQRAPPLFPPLLVPS